MILPQKAYEIIRWIVIIVLPAAITLYGVIGNTLNIPYTEVVLTIPATCFDILVITVQLLNLSLVVTQSEVCTQIKIFLLENLIVNG